MSLNHYVSVGHSGLRVSPFYGEPFVILNGSLVARNLRTIRQSGFLGANRLQSICVY